MSTTIDTSSASMTTAEAAGYLHVAVGTLANWRSNGTGPQYVKLGGTVRYRQVDLDAYLEQCRVSTSVSA